MQSGGLKYQSFIPRILVVVVVVVVVVIVVVVVVVVVVIVVVVVVIAWVDCTPPHLHFLRTRTTQHVKIDVSSICAGNKKLCSDLTNWAKQ